MASPNFESQTSSKNPVRLGGAAVGYLRRSTDRQEQSIPDQKKAIEKYAEDQGFHILRFYTDDAISGTSTIGRRAFAKTPAATKVEGERACYQMLSDLFQRLMQAGYIDMAAQKVDAQVTHLNIEADLTQEIQALGSLAKELGLATQFLPPPPIKEVIETIRTKPTGDTP